MLTYSYVKTGVLINLSRHVLLNTLIFTKNNNAVLTLQIEINV